MGKKIDLTNQKFNRLTVLQEYGRDKRREVIWQCQCECGNVVNVLSSNLRKGATQSCGCLQREQAGKNAPIRNLSNQRFGKLIALSPTEKRLNGQVIWLCKCDCGNLTQVRSYNLVSNKTLSCGCLNQSHGEYKIEQLLLHHNIPYVKEKIFSNCIFDDTLQFARFDFFVDDKYLIEFDGEQHFTYDDTRSGWNTKEHFLTLQKHDNYKNNWCKTNNIPLIRIPYTHLDKLQIEDLLLETSPFKKEI